MIVRAALFSLLAGASLLAFARSDVPEVAKPAARGEDVQAVTGTPAASARAAVRKLNPNAVVDSIGEAPPPLQGFQEVIVGGQALYISDDGKYLIQGGLLDIDTRKNLAEAGLSRVRRALLAQLPQADRIVFAPPDPKYRVTVFTDIECIYCRKLHSEIAQYNQQGIAVEYLAFPRMGPASEDFRRMEAVWCASDRRAALTAAKSGKPAPAKACKNPVAMQYGIGQRAGAGVFGTPMILAEDGTQLGGYRTPADLRAALDKMAAEAVPAKKASGGA